MAEVRDGYGLILVRHLALSFQRYPESEARSRGAPKSHGALPVALVGPAVAIVPLATGEALWIGLSPVSMGRPSVVGWASLAASAGLQVPMRRVVSSFGCINDLGRDSCLIRDPRSREAPPCPGIVVRAIAPDDADREQVEIRFVSPEEFEARSGRAAPRATSLASTYEGWLLP